MPQLLNDDCIVPSLVEHGIPVREARDYIAVGCDEISVHGHWARCNGGYPLLKNFPASEKFSLCQEIKQSCYKLIRAAVMANNLTNVNRRLMWLDEADAEKTLLLVLLGVAKNQKYITQKKLLELQGKLEEIGRIIGGLQKFFINNRK